jgi:hypothetical protein
VTLPEQEFKRAIREYLAGDVPEGVRETVERLELEIASPGDWELAKYQEIAETGKAETSD